jgi:hypothetical protein
MRVHAMRLLSAAAVAVTLVWFQSASAATAADATGTWKWQATFGGNTVDITLKLKQDGEKLTGAISGREGTPDTDIKDGKIVNGAISFSVVREFNGNTNTQTYNGKLEGDSIKGKTVRERNGEKMESDWEAKRS